MPLKDHYRTLGISANATLPDIKKAYRILAHKYHPDKNPDNAFAANHFREIQEAYRVLSDDKKRRNYDEERYFAGLSIQKESAKISGEWLYKQSRKLSTHMANVDSYRMNHRALYDYVMLLLSESHLAVLKQENNQQMNKHIIEEILYSIKGIHFQYLPELLQRLTLLADNDKNLNQLLLNTLHERRKKAAFEKFLPVIVIAITILMCIIMYFYSHKTR